MGTWRSNGGQGSPANATREEQIAVAERVAAARGTSPWPHCGVDGGSSAHVTSHSSSHSSKTTTKKTTHKAAVSAPVTTAAPQSAPNGDYTVVSGDTLSTIAQKQNVAGGWEALWNNNKSIVANPNLIFPGQSLVTK
jgi:nucleoid-associated protein YgaU